MLDNIIPKNSYSIINNNNNNTKSEYNITFRITDSCNLKCEYCHWNNGINYSTVDIKETILNLFNFFNINKINNILFYFHGGEPSIHPDVIEILQYIRELEKKFSKIILIEFQTNLVSPKIKEIIKYIDYLSISLHYMELIKREQLTKFNTNYNYLKEINYTINNLDIMLEDVPDLNKFYSFILELLEYKNILSSEMIYGFCHYSKNEITYNNHFEFYKKYNKSEQLYKIDGVKYNTNELFQRGLNCKDWNCEAGINDITINGDGNVFKCGIHMTNFTTRCTNDKPFTNIIKDKIWDKKLSILRKTGTKCQWEYCGGDFYIPRKNPKDIK